MSGGVVAYTTTATRPPPLLPRARHRLRGDSAQVTPKHWLRNFINGAVITVSDGAPMLRATSAWDNVDASIVVAAMPTSRRRVRNAVSTNAPARGASDDADHRWDPDCGLDQQGGRGCRHVVGVVPQRRPPLLALRVQVSGRRRPLVEALGVQRACAHDVGGPCRRQPDIGGWSPRWTRCRRRPSDRELRSVMGRRRGRRCGSRTQPRAAATSVK